ncbi:MAG: hypothetical protein JRD94_17235, partial [Deltaproteobacteria bacterium]|nr:hypothetical protein [Deltaproteobacteria bacterium]
WSGEDLDELMELLETQLTDANVDLKYTALEKDDSADSNDSNDDDGEDEEDEEEPVTEDDDDD